VSRLPRWLLLAVLALLIAAYLVFSHLLTIEERPSLLMLALGITPLTVMALLAAWLSRLRWWALGLLVLVVAAVLWQLDTLRSHINWLYFMQHAGAMALLAITFGSTLWRSDEEALCSRVTRLILAGAADPAYMRYTWKVTLAWTLYFVLSGLLSVGFFFWGPIAVWSIFANLLTPVLVGLMFLIEYLVRVRVLPERAHFSIAQTIQAYRTYEKS